MNYNHANVAYIDAYVIKHIILVLQEQTLSYEKVKYIVAAY